jgi:TonB-linked SusC/RagA family outer membrane protein
MKGKLFFQRGIGRDIWSKLFVLLLFLTIGPLAMAQKTVTGTILDATDNSGMPGANVAVKGTSTAAMTDVDGKYSITVPNDQAVLVFSFIGKVPQEVVVGNRTVIEVSLADETTTLTEVVVVGYGTAKRKDLTGSVASIAAKDMNPGINPNPLQAIQGKVAGLVITQPSGDPTQDPTVRLRGYTSLAGGSDPLYVVDGMIGVPINTISPTDIETMDVLKDASAAAIYGSRAANGVILITTKRGKVGKPTISFNNYIGTSTISRRLDLLDGAGYVDAVKRIEGADAVNDGLKFPKDASGNFHSTDWVKEITQNAFIHNHDLAISGGSQGLTYRGSVNYLGQDGLLKNTGLNRTTARINLDQKAFDNRLNIMYNLAYTETLRKYTIGNIMERATAFLPTLPVRDKDGEFYELRGVFNMYNPVAMMENYRNDQNRKMLQGGMNLRYELFDGFTVGASGQIQRENGVTDYWTNPNIYAFEGANGRASRSYFEAKSKLLELTANYYKSLSTESNMSFLVGYSYQQNDNDGFQAANNGFVTDFVTIDNLGLGSGTLINPRNDYATSYRNQTKLISFFGRATVNLKDKYNLTATVRQDGSSKFGDNHKWGIFPSFGAGWIISNEEFFGQPNGLNYLKLRFGWGQTGNSEGISPYNSMMLYGQSGTYYDGAVGDFLPGYAITQNANPNLKWEVLETTNLGLDFQVAKGRYSGTIEWYNKLTKDMLYNYSVPANGVDYFTNSILANVGTMKNSGLEFSFGGAVIEKKNFSWTPQLVLSYNKNKIVSLSSDALSAGQVRFNPFGGRGLSDVFASYLVPGRPLGEFNNVPTFKEFNSNGDVVMVGGDGQGTTDVSKSDAYTAVSAGNPISQGNPQPFLTGALSNMFRYGNFDLTFQLRGTFGNKILNQLRNNLMLPGSILQSNMLADVNTLPDNYETNRLTSLWIENGSFVRLDNWQVGYNIPTSGKTVSNARVYFGGNNLLLFTKYKGIDPELQTKGDLENNRSQRVNSMGMDGLNVYPKTRSFQLGLNLTF